MLGCHAAPPADLWVGAIYRRGSLHAVHAVLCSVSLLVTVCAENLLTEWHGANTALQRVSTLVERVQLAAPRHSRIKQHTYRALMRDDEAGRCRVTDGEPMRGRATPMRVPAARSSRSWGGTSTLKAWRTSRRGLRPFWKKSVGSPTTCWMPAGALLPIV